ncbi:unnamed protein product [Peniophora sp. CBMAI 1063]|nr:unnamed protein product [Peniophora sp. CBMAI 1063]
MPSTWPVLLRSRVAWACVAVIVGASWLLTWRWQDSLEHPMELDGSRAELEVPQTASATLGSLEAWFPPLDEAIDSGGFRRVEAHNARHMRNLLRCMQAKTCGKNQRKVVILEDLYLGMVLRGTDWLGGEMIWANSTVNALQTLGYTYFFARQWDQVLSFHNMFPDLVVAVVMSPETMTGCWGDKYGCVKSPHNPNGIPIWKILTFYFWGNEISPLDGRWVLSPEPWGTYGTGYPNTYLGYSIDERCTRHAFVPTQTRERRAYLLTKFLRFLVHNDYDGDPAWPADVWQRLTNELDVTLVASIKIDVMPDDSPLPAGLPAGIVRLPELGPEEFVDELAKSRVLIGLGNPRTSPTPYEALCMGVPFINPVLSWNEHDPDDTSQWTCQHETLCRYGPGPPYVYNVKRGDRHALIAAIQAALDHPIERYILEMTKQSAVVERLDAILSQDRLGMARELLQQREEGTRQGELFDL